MSILLYLSTRSPRRERRALREIAKRVRNVICEQVVMWNRARHTRSNGRCFVSTVSRKGLENTKLSRSVYLDSCSRFSTSGKKRDFRSKQDYKDSVSLRYLSNWIATMTEKSIDLLRKCEIIYENVS